MGDSRQYGAKRLFGRTGRAVARPDVEQLCRHLTRIPNGVDRVVATGRTKQMQRSATSVSAPTTILKRRWPMSFSVPRGPTIQAFSRLLAVDRSRISFGTPRRNCSVGSWRRLGNRPGSVGCSAARSGSPSRHQHGTRSRAFALPVPCGTRRRSSPATTIRCNTGLVTIHPAHCLVQAACCAPSTGTTGA